MRLVNSSKLYELDFYAWTQQQAKFLRERDWSYLDVQNLVEEIESLNFSFLPGQQLGPDGNLEL